MAHILASSVQPPACLAVLWRRCTPKLQQTAPAHVIVITPFHAEHTDHTCFNTYTRSILEDGVFDKRLSRAMLRNCFATCLVKFALKKVSEV